MNFAICTYNLGLQYKREDDLEQAKNYCDQAKQIMINIGEQGNNFKII